jgi:hypothetical protein
VQHDTQTAKILKDLTDAYSIQIIWSRSEAVGKTSAPDTWVVGQSCRVEWAEDSYLPSMYFA